MNEEDFTQDAAPEHLTPEQPTSEPPTPEPLTPEPPAIDPTAIEQTELAAFASPFEAQPVIAEFWRRAIAFTLDILGFGVLGIVAGFVLFDPLANLGAWGRLLGFSIALVYFAVLDSRLGQGQTLGKRVMRIHVIDKSGQHIPVGKAAARYAVLAAPVFLNGLAVPVTAVPTVLSYLISFIIFGLGGALVYLFVFNRRTRQSVHDLAVGTYVARVAHDGAVSVSMWKPHLLITAGWLVLVMLGGVAATLLAQSLPPGMTETIEAIDETGKVHTASCFIGKSWGTGGETTYVNVRAVLKRPATDEAALTQEMAEIVLAEFPEASKVDYVDITLVRGFDIGFASGWKSTGRYMPPAEWREASGGSQ